jgi:SAM-dependent methyltransferase
MPSVSDVQRFWDANPLFTGESSAPVGSPAFFEEHRRLVIEDGVAGAIYPEVFPLDVARQKILDVGCGIGFWFREFWDRGARDLTGVDLSPRSVELARRRCELLGVRAAIHVANAEQLPFADATFTHINCHGVVHHTPHPGQAVAEIARVLKPGGTACVSVYYRNILLRGWPLIGGTVRAVSGGLSGRGRESMLAQTDASEIVRMYDGAANPIGYCYSREEFRDLLKPLRIEKIFYQYFPKTRALPFAIPRSVHKMLEWASPFLIWAKLRKA